MLNPKMTQLGKVRSEIREIFEYANKRKKEIGAGNVFDFSIGNPSVPAPGSVERAIEDLIKNTDPVLLHGYTSAQGDAEVREIVASDLNRRFGTDLGADSIYMTAGAAASMTIILNAVVLPGDECVIFAPYFPEYKVFVEASGAKAVIVRCEEPSFQIDTDAFERALNEKTKAVIINSPNNPSGVVYSKETILRLCEIMKEKEREYGHEIYLISDEPYRALVYDDTEVPFLIPYYDDTFVCYSYSKALSLPGERIGYIAVSNRMKNERDAYAAVCGAGRALGYVCAPSMFQRVAAICVDDTSDISIYKKNRDLLYHGLKDLGFECVYPDGAFYLFVKAMEEDAHAFCERAKEFELLFVASDSFGVPGYVRVSYCVPTEQIRRAMPKFAALAKTYK